MTLNFEPPTDSTPLLDLVQSGVDAFQDGRKEEAEAAFLSALKRSEQLQSNDPLILDIINNLAVVYQSQSQYGKAEALHKRALEIIEQTLGKNHPESATTFNNLAELCRRQDRNEEAERLYKRALSIQQKADEYSSNMLRFLQNYARFLHENDRTSEAAAILQLEERLNDVGGEQADFVRELGQRIADARERKGWSHERLANEANVDRVALIEAGELNPSIKALYRIAKALDITVRDLTSP